MAFIAPDGFLSNNNSKSYKLVREHLLNNSDLEKVVTLQEDLSNHIIKPKQVFYILPT